MCSTKKLCLYLSSHSDDASRKSLRTSWSAGGRILTQGYVCSCDALRPIRTNLLAVWGEFAKSDCLCSLFLSAEYENSLLRDTKRILKCCHITSSMNWRPGPKGPERLVIFFLWVRIEQKDATFKAFSQNFDSDDLFLVYSSVHWIVRAWWSFLRRFSVLLIAFLLGNVLRAPECQNLIDAPLQNFGTEDFLSLMRCYSNQSGAIQGMLPYIPVQSHCH